jgi:hypothetical protein
MDCRDRATLDDLYKLSTLSITQLRRLAEGFAVKQATGPTRIEPYHPVAHDLQTDPTDPRRIAAAAAVINLSQRQQSAGLVRTLP